MCIYKSFDSPNTPLQELYSLIKYEHPNLKSTKIRSISTTKELMHFQVIRDVEVPVSELLLKRLFSMSSNVVTLCTNVKVYHGNRKIEMTTIIPKRFKFCVSGFENVMITEDIDKGSKVEIKLEYNLVDSYKLLPIARFISMAENMILDRYKEKRLKFFATPCDKDIKSISEIVVQSS